MGRRARRAMEAFLAAVICALIAGAFACGAGPQPLSATTTSVDAASAHLLVVQDYRSRLEDWVKTYLEGADIHALDGLQHPQYPTQQDLKRARDFTAYTRRMLAALREIDPPPDIVQAHCQYVDSIAAELTALDRLLLGFESGNERDLELGLRDASAAYAKTAQALSALSAYIDLPALTQN
jgi:hypothetical protein